jgi:hypothetical protein
VANEDSASDSAARAEMTAIPRRLASSVPKRKSVVLPTLPPHETGDWPNPPAPHRAARALLRARRRGLSAPRSSRSRKAASRRRPSKGQHVIDPPVWCRTDVEPRHEHTDRAPAENLGPTAGVHPAANTARHGQRPCPVSG